MTPRLVLLTGPAAGEVANLVPLIPTSYGMTTFEVRDYWEAPRLVSDRIDSSAYLESTERVIRSLPGGEAWLVGLVIPDGSGARANCYADFWEMYQNQGSKNQWGPARLAILAPDPPALLVERVRAWGGEVWQCAFSASGYCMVLTNGGPAHGGGQHLESTWPEAVRVALGEA